MSKLLGRLWIAGTVSLISFIAYSSQIFILIPLLSLPESLKLLLPFNLLVLLVFLNYGLCVRTDPGTVPNDWHNNIHDKFLLANLRYCNACRLYKPPRAHHCRHCHRCVLKMDHHCPWVNNCIGYFNHAHFFRFLVSVDMACCYHIWLISKRAFGELTYGPPPTTTEMLFLITNYVACLPVIMAVGVFSIYHLWCLLNNTTNIEIGEKEKAAELRRKGRINQFIYPFSLGIFGNVQAVLGTNPLTWIFPQPMRGDGLSFPTTQGQDPLEQYLWPPRDLFTRRTQGRKVANRPSQPFTYGHSINPQLTATSSLVPGFELAGPRRRLVSPYHPHYQEAEQDELSDSVSSPAAHGYRPDCKGTSNDDTDDDDEPLGKLLARRRGQWINPDHPPAPRVRRGSEGYEVRPAKWGSPTREVSMDEDVEWAYEVGSEGSDG